MLSCRMPGVFFMARSVGAALFLAFVSRIVLGATDEEGLRFLEENKARDGVITRPSGLQYEVLASGDEDGVRPNASTPCVCHYQGTLLNGEEFDSSIKRNAPATFKPNQVIKGWTEALQLMRPGDKWKLFIPSELGYGDRGAGGKIPGKAVLIFELELLHLKAGADGPVEMLTNFAKEQPMMLVLGAFVLYSIYSKFFSGGAGGKELSLAEAISAEENAKVFMEIQIGDDEPERVEFILFSKHYPKTADNFRALCTGEKGTGKSGKALTYKDCAFHRIIPGFMCQGGDFTAGDGRGGESIYGEKFADEWDNGYVAHSKGGFLSMANAGANTNGSQFFITLGATPHLNGKHVVFGQVTDGMAVVKKMEATGSSGGSTRKKVVVTDCGEVKSKST